MEIRIGFKMVLFVSAPTPIIALACVHPEIAHQLKKNEDLAIDPDVPREQFIDQFGNRAVRFVAREGSLCISYESIIVAPDEPDPVFLNALQRAVEELPTDVLQFLLPSRYCEVDLMGDIAWQLFSHTNPGWDRVQAVSDWVHCHIEFGYEHASPTMTAMQVYDCRKGVCRDFAHLAITFCRCLNIPARYATGYLGYIRVPRGDAPPDFSAYFEAYLGGRWHVFDARNNARRYGRVLMARGRDAADAALTTSFTPCLLEQFEVWTDEV